MNQESSPKISLLIPVYNVEDSLDACLNSAENQTLKEIEIICVDDGSADRSSDILKQHAARDSRFTILRHDRNRGLFSARKTAAEKATGHYIMFLDSDDTLMPNACETAYRKIEMLQVDVFHFGANIIPGRNIPRKNRSDIRKFIRPYSGMLEKDAVFFACFGPKPEYSYTLWDKIISSELCKQAYSLVDEFFLTVHEDLYLYFALALLTRRYYGENIPLYNYQFARGVYSGTVRQISEEQFERYCTSSQIPIHLQNLLTRLQKTEAPYQEALNTVQRNLFHTCHEKLLLLQESSKGKELFIQSWLHGDQSLFEILQQDRLLLQNYKDSLSVRLGLFLTWILRKLLTILTGRKF